MRLEELMHSLDLEAPTLHRGSNRGSMPEGQHGDRTRGALAASQEELHMMSSIDQRSLLQSIAWSEEDGALDARSILRASLRASFAAHQAGWEETSASAVPGAPAGAESRGLESTGLARMLAMGPDWHTRETANLAQRDSGGFAGGASARFG